jgi:hypothetical protein
VSAGHPEGLPDLFLDRSLGRRQVPALLREAGLRLHTLAEVYGVPETRTSRHGLAGAGWAAGVACAHEGRAHPVSPSRARPVVAHPCVQAFCLTGGNLRAAAMAEQYLAVIDDLAQACLSPGPFLYAVSARGLRRLDL